MSGRRFITLKKHICLKCHMHQSILCLILIFQIFGFEEASPPLITQSQAMYNFRSIA